MAKKKILSVSLIDETFQYLEVNEQAAGFFAESPPLTLTDEALMAACRKADKIYINAAFPSTQYIWDLFPKVAKRYMNDLVGKNAHEQLAIPERLWVEYKAVEEVVDAGVTKQRIAYVGLREDEVLPVWDKFKVVHQKIEHITSLQVALASIITRIDHPAENFISAWIGETSSVISISSPEGIVKVARTIPVGLPKTDLPSETEFLTTFTEEIDREITRSSTFFKQEFREPDPKILYLIGNPRLQEIIREHPLTETYDIHFGLADMPVQGWTESQVNENIHLIGNLYLSREFNFIPRKEVITRKLGLGFKLSYAVLLILILLGGAWSYGMLALKNDRIKAFDQAFSQFQETQKRVITLREDVNRLKPFEGWYKLYIDTYKNTPPWNMLLSELALLVPSDIVINNFQLSPGNGTAWNGQLSGDIQAEDWQKGLNILRQFGGKLQSSRFFDVKNVQYTPKGLEAETKMFDFSISLNLLSDI